MFKTKTSAETRVVSLNTDSIAIQIQKGDEDRVADVISDWEKTFGFKMDRVEVIAHRGLNINSYIEVVREGDGKPYLKSKGSLAHDPGIMADHNQLVVAKAIGHWMLDGTPIEQFIRDAAAKREILNFTEMRSAPSSTLRYGGESIGRIARVYRSTRRDLPKITKDATGAASEQQLENGFAYLSGIDWPDEDDVDIEWYIQQAMLIVAQTSTKYSPHHNKLAHQIADLGLDVAGVGGAATVIANGEINEEAIAKGTEKNPRNFSGDRGLAVSVSKTSGVIGVPAGVLDVNSLVLSYGYDDKPFGEIHLRALMDKSQFKEMKSKGVDIEEKGYVKVYDSRDGLIPLTVGSSVPLNEVVNTNGPRSNDQFLDVMFGESITDAFVCSNTTPPDSENELAKTGMWMGGPLHFSNDRYKDSTRQNYTCVSGFKTDAEGVYYRQNEYFDALYFIVLDDIGTKVSIDPRTIGFGEPTFINETSPGNHQWYYRLSEPVRDLSIASYLTKQVLATPVQGYLMTDQGAKGITRLCKLPHGMNLKLSLGKPWQNKSVSWQPDLSYSAQTIAGWFGMQIDNVPHINATPSASATQASDHPLIHALHSAQLLMSAQQKGSGWWDIICHQRHLHSVGAGVDSGTAIKIREDGSWTYRCQHGHCADMKPRDLYRYLSEKGFNLTPPQHKIYIKRIDRDRLRFDESVVDGDNFSFLDPDDGGANEEVDYPDPEIGGGGAGISSMPSSVLSLGPGKPTIYIDPGHLPSIVKSCSKILDDVIFKRGIYLVRIGRGSELEDGLSRIGSQPVVLPVTRPWLVRELTERAVFLRWNEKINDYKVIDCPNNVATTLETGTDDYTFRPLTALANAPFLRVDGSICDSPGYDSDTGIYYAPNLVFPSISSAPSWQEARDALDLIGNLVKQFPFANAVSKSVFLSDVLTAIARPTLPKSPVVLYNATMAGSGKTLMASVANLITYGHATTHPWPGVNEEELKKVFTSVLLAGDPVVVFDNLPNGAMIKSAALSQFATSDDYADRKLGFSERVKFRNRTRVVLTGNNITLASDNARRTLVCDLQLEVESIKDRVIDFEYPSLALHIKQNRPLYIAAALTVLKAYAVHDDPLMLAPLDSFEDWSWRVREALVWLGEEDPVAAVNYENDGSGEIANVFATIQSVVNMKQTANKEKDFKSNDLANWAAGNFALRDALEQAGCTDTNSSAKLGFWLRAHKNRIAGGLKLVCKQIDGGRKPSKWLFVLPSNHKNE